MHSNRTKIIKKSNFTEDKIYCDELNDFIKRLNDFIKV